MMIQVSRDAGSALRGIKVCRQTGALQNCCCYVGTQGFKVPQPLHGQGQQERGQGLAAVRLGPSINTRRLDDNSQQRRRPTTTFTRTGRQFLRLEFERGDEVLEAERLPEFDLWRPQDSMETRHTTTRPLGGTTQITSLIIHANRDKGPKGL